LLRVILLTPRILRELLGFWNTCGPVSNFKLVTADWKKKHSEQNGIPRLETALELFVNVAHIDSLLSLATWSKLFINFFLTVRHP
jgi:hypothetical protein